MKKKLIVLTLIIVLIGLCWYTITQNNNAVVKDSYKKDVISGSKKIKDIFPDEALAREIAKELNLEVNDKIKQSDLNDVENLYLDDSAKDINGVQYLKRLKTFMYYGIINNYNYLSGCPKLSSVYVLVSTTEQVELLLSLNKIDNLNLVTNINDFKYPEKLSEAKLSTLSLSNGIIDLSYLNSDKIEVLMFEDVEIKNIEKIDELENLYSLDLDIIQPIDMKLLDNLNLDHLALKGNFSELPSSFEGNNLLINNRGDADLKNLCNYDNLDTLSLEMLNIDPTTISCISGLETLILNAYLPEDFSFVKDLKKLNNLDIYGVDKLYFSGLITNVNQLNKLSRISITNANYVDLSNIALLKPLKSFEISYANIVDYKPLLTLDSSTTIIAAGNYFNYEDFAKEMKALNKKISEY